ncbi:unnamed protein product [Paramecium pentaurelia]|uniref:Uncharacterized protein n=1 Tax=Paramecium pentaurelia TaxID=43138 RepID=A0A8S1WMD4_9CILI|nr:unnamed protein product [Paramecium pentaurelia]
MQYIDENEMGQKSRVPRLSMGERCFGKDLSNFRQSKSQSQTQRIKFDELDLIDNKNNNNPQLVSVYAKDIYKYCRSKDKALDHTYIDKQIEINYKMRAILIDWLVDVHYRFNLVSDTLYLTIYIIDAYLQQIQISRNKFQLLGVSALFIASKYCEIYPPKLNYYSDVTDKTYTKEEILEMEGKILMQLQFEICFTNQHQFYDRYQQLIQLDQKSYQLGKYILELMLLDHKFIQYNPSLQAASVLYLVQKIYKKSQNCWPTYLEIHSQYNENQIRIVAKEICQQLCQAKVMSLQAIQRKYSSPKFQEVSNIQIQYK